MNKHPLYLGHLVETPQDFYQTLCCPAARARLVRVIGKVACAKADHGIDLVENGCHDLPGLARSELFSCFRVYNFYNAVVRKVHTVFLKALVAQTSNVSGSVSLPHDHLKALLQLITQGFGQHFTRHKPYFKIKVLLQVIADLPGLLGDLNEKARGADISGDFKVVHHTYLKLGVANTSGCCNALQPVKGIFKPEGRWYEVVTKSNLADVASSKPGCKKCLCPAIILTVNLFRLINGARRHADPFETIPRHTQKPTKGWILFLELSQLMFMGDREPLQVVHTLYVIWLDLAFVKLLPDGRCVLIGMLHDLLKLCILVSNPFFPGKGFKALAVIAGYAIRSWCHGKQSP